MPISLVKIKFGTDGWRAIIAQEYTVQNVARVTKAVAIWLKQQKPNPPELILGKGAFITIEQDSSKMINKPIKISTEEDLGLVSLKIETKIKNYIVQLTDSENKVIHSLSNIKDHTFKHLEPMEYRLRIIIDENNNGIWDAGNFYEKREPEKVILYKSEEGKFSFPLRANWEYGPVLIKF